MREAKITIEGRELTEEQSRVVRMAVSLFVRDMRSLNASEMGYLIHGLAVVAIFDDMVP